MGTGLEWVPPTAEFPSSLRRRSLCPQILGRGRQEECQALHPAIREMGFPPRTCREGEARPLRAALPGGWALSWACESICHEGNEQFSDVLKGGPSRLPETLSGRTKPVPRCTGREATGRKLAGHPFFK